MNATPCFSDALLVYEALVSPDSMSPEVSILDDSHSDLQEILVIVDLQEILCTRIVTAQYMLQSTCK